MRLGYVKSYAKQEKNKMTQSQLTFPSASPLLKWAGASYPKRLDDEIIYVLNGENFYYFGKYPDGYRLVMVSSQDIAESEN